MHSCVSSKSLLVDDHQDQRNINKYSHKVTDGSSEHFSLRIHYE